MEIEIKDILKALMIGFLITFSIGFGITRPVAREITLIGYCNGKLMGALEEGNFPDNCDWIEKVNYNVE